MSRQSEPSKAVMVRVHGLGKDGAFVLPTAPVQRHILWYMPITNRGAMSQVAKLFTNGRSQAVRLPAACRFDTREVFIRKDAQTGDVILSRKPATWDGFFDALKGVRVPEGFMGKQERAQASPVRDPFEGWRE